MAKPAACSGKTLTRGVNANAREHASHASCSRVESCESCACACVFMHEGVRFMYMYTHDWRTGVRNNIAEYIYDICSVYKYTRVARRCAHLCFVCVLVVVVYGSLRAALKCVYTAAHKYYIRSTHASDGACLMVSPATFRKRENSKTTNIHNTEHTTHTCEPNACHHTAYSTHNFYITYYARDARVRRRR